MDERENEKKIELKIEFKYNKEKGHTFTRRMSLKTKNVPEFEEATNEKVLE